jgi:hypothetical protein
LERAFIWATNGTTSGAKCKVNWDIICRPKIYGGLGVLHLEKFASTLRLCCPWLEWKDPSKIWVGYDNPFSKEDMDLFYGATTIILGNGNKTPFWHSPWLEGRYPKMLHQIFLNFAKGKN